MAKYINIDDLGLGECKPTPSQERYLSKKSYADGWNSLYRILKDAPTADMRPMVRATWKWELADNGWANHICSECGWKKNTDIHVGIDYKYCPSCGADMREARNV